MVIVPRVILDAEKAGATLRRPYPQTSRIGKRAMAISMAHHQRRLYCRGRTSERGLVLT